MALDEYGRITDDRSYEERDAAVMAAISTVFEEASIGGLSAEQKQELAETVGKAVTAGLKAANVQVRNHSPRR